MGRRQGVVGRGGRLGLDGVGLAIHLELAARGPEGVANRHIKILVGHIARMVERHDHHLTGGHRQIHAHVIAPLLAALFDGLDEDVPARHPRGQDAEPGQPPAHLHAGGLDPVHPHERDLTGGIRDHAGPPAPSVESSVRATIRASVVSMSDATDAAFWSATRTTLVGSMTPAFTRSSYSSVAALKPKAPLPFLTLSTTIAPSTPALMAICRKGSSMARRTMFTPYCRSSLNFRF